MKSIEFLKEKGVNVDKSLELFGDMSIYNATMQDFLDGIEEKKQNLKNAKDTENWPNYGIFAHSIKSDARYLGFSDYAQEFLAHEMAGKEADQHFIIKDYDNMVNRVDEMISIVSEYLKGEETNKNLNNDENTNMKGVIIVADDSPLITNFVKRILGNEYFVIEAKDGAEVINYISNNDNHVSALLLDLNMPNVNGFKVLDYFNENNLFSKIPVTIITGDDSKEMVDRAFTYGIIEVLNKPFSAEALKNVVDKTVKGS